MANFDFITDDSFRECLMADYAELQSCLEAKAWKAAHVLAGSIIEAILSDHLQSSNTTTTKSSVLKMELGHIIDACKSANILSAKSAELSSVIKQYRNLIHPGRTIRLGETATSAEAAVAMSLIDIIADEISVHRKATYGFTAEQILKKAFNDKSSRPILPHLLKAMNEHQIERLLCKVIPREFDRLYDPDPFSDEDSTESLNACTFCYRTALDVAPDTIKTRAAQRFANLVKGCDVTGDYITSYEDAFFCICDANYLEPVDHDMVKRHILGRISSQIDEGILRVLDKFGQIFTPIECVSLMDSITPLFVNVKPGTRIVAATTRFLTEQTRHTTTEADAAMRKRLDYVYKWYIARGLDDRASMIQLLADCIPDPDPFDDE